VRPVVLATQDGCRNILASVAHSPADSAVYKYDSVIDE
jgi:hypothetical protein